MSFRERISTEYTASGGGPLMPQTAYDIDDYETGLNRNHLRPQRGTAAEWSDDGLTVRDDWHPFTSDEDARLADVLLTEAVRLLVGGDALALSRAWTRWHELSDQEQSEYLRQALPAAAWRYRHGYKRRAVA